MRGLTRLRHRKSDDRQTGDTVAPLADGHRHGWQVVSQPRAYRWARLGVRLLIAVPLLVLAGLGVRSVVAPATAPALAASPAGNDVDTTAAVSTAESVARTWLTLDEQGARTSRLALTWQNPGSAGWDGQGSLQQVGGVYTVATQVVSETAIDVTVAVYVRAGEEGPAGWVGVMVPMQLDPASGAASVRESPRIVGLPDPQPAAAEPTGDTDRTLTADTRDTVNAFVTAWASGDAGDITAPGTIVPPLPTNLASGALIDWTVYDGTGTSRTGQARIAWTIGEATITCDYTITITTVTSGASSRWQVSNIH